MLLRFRALPDGSLNTIPKKQRGIMRNCKLNLVTTNTQDSKYRSYSLRNFKKLPQIEKLSEEQKFAIEVVSQILPFKTNNYVTEELIDWDNIPNDPIFILNFPQKEMLKPKHFEEMAMLISNNAGKEKIQNAANRIRMELNPHSSGQMKHNRPSINGKILNGMQHKYKETVLFFPSHGQTCHAYCSFCFRWPQFIGINDLKFSTRDIYLLIKYVRRHTKITDVLFTGGDPLVMSSKILSSYINPLIEAGISNLKTIRIGTKTLGYWPYRFTSDSDADKLLALFNKVTRSGIHLSIMAHFNSPRELETDAVYRAIKRIRETGAQIRTQSPLLANINDKAEIWSEMWKKQVELGCISYYMFIARNTGAKHYFCVPLVRAWKIFRKAYQSVSGLSRTVRGPSMSAHPGKVQILGVSKINGEKVFVMQFLQARNPDWVSHPFFAEYNEDATWLDELKPAFGEDKFFFNKVERTLHFC